jgi:hypothetical protein
VVWVRMACAHRENLMPAFQSHTSPAENAVQSKPGYFWGRAFVLCACLLWLASCAGLPFIGGIGGIAGFLFIIACLLATTIGGAYSALKWRSIKGAIASYLGALYLLAVMMFFLDMSVYSLSVMPLGFSCLAFAGVAAFGPAMVLIIWPVCANGISRARRAASASFGMLLLLGIALVAAFLYQAYWQSCQGEENTAALLDGNQNVRLQRFEIEGQQRRVTCSDPVVLRYLEDCFRTKNDPNQKQSGLTFRLSLVFDDDSRFHREVSWCKENLALFVFQHVGDGPATHNIVFPAPMPPKMKQIIDFLTRPADELEQNFLDVRPAE